MADYAIQSGLERIAEGIKRVADAWSEQNKIEREKMAMELAQQKREWLVRGLSKELFNV